MKIKELIVETENHMKLYWILKGFDIDSYFSVFTQYTNMKSTVISKSLMMELYSKVHELLVDSNWQYLENDPDFDKTYDDLLDLCDAIQEYLTNA